jgi:VCBS repeat-containing protein
MKLFYLLLVSLLFIACKKDLDEDIVGTWEITDVEKIGAGSSIPAGLPFQSGKLTLNANGTASYTNGGSVYTGKWTLERKKTGDQYTNALMVSVVDFGTQQIIMDVFDDIIFPGRDHFKGRVSFDSKSYMTHFKR